MEVPVALEPAAPVWQSAAGWEKAFAKRRRPRDVARPQLQARPRPWAKKLAQAWVPDKRYKYN